MAVLGHLQGAEVAYGLVKSRDSRGVEGLEVVIALLLHRNTAQTGAGHLAHIVLVVKLNLKDVVGLLAHLLGNLNLVLVKDEEDKAIVRFGTAILHLRAVVGLNDGVLVLLPSPDALRVEAMGHRGRFNGVVECAVLKVLEVGRHNRQDRVGVGQGHKAHDLLKVVLKRCEARVVLREITLLGSVIKAQLVVLPVPNAPGNVHGLVEVRHGDRLVDVLAVVELVGKLVRSLLLEQLFRESIVVGVNTKPHLHFYAGPIGRVEIGNIEFVRPLLHLVLLVLSDDVV